MVVDGWNGHFWVLLCTRCVPAALGAARSFPSSLSVPGALVGARALRVAARWAFGPPLLRPCGARPELVRGAGVGRRSCEPTRLRQLQGDGFDSRRQAIQ